METVLMSLVVFLVVVIVVETIYFNFIAINRLEKKMYQELTDILSISSDTFKKLSDDIETISDGLSDSIDQTDKALIDSMEKHNNFVNVVAEKLMNVSNRFNEVDKAIECLSAKKPTKAKKGRPKKEEKK